MDSVLYTRMARRLMYCKVILATSMVWFMLDVALIMYYIDCSDESRCPRAQESGIGPHEDSKHGEYMLSLGMCRWVD